MTDETDVPSNVLPINEEVAKALGNRHSKLRAMECYPTFHDRLVEGWASTTLASYIQDTCGELMDMERDSLCKAIDRYRGDLPASVRAGEKLPNAVSRAANEIEKGINEIEELAKLYRLQVRRIDMEVENETELLNGKLLEGTREEIKEARAILKDSSDLKQALGLTPHHLGTLGLNVDGGVVHAHTSLDDITNPKVKAVLEDPQSRRRLLGLADRFMQLSEKDGTDQIIDAEYSESEAEAPPPAPAPEPSPAETPPET